MTHAQEVRLREYLERIMDERDRRYEDRFKAQETAVYAALAAQEKLTNAAFASSEKAIVKAEDAQRDYNVRSNEFRGQLDDQNKVMSNEMLRRAEAEQRFDAQDEKIDEIKKDVGGLRESRSGMSGRDDALDAARQAQRWAIGLGVTLLLFVAGSVIIPLLKATP